MARNVAWGIDIGESAIKAVRIRRVGDSVELTDYRTIPCEAPPEEAQGGDKDYRVRNALATLQREVKLPGAVLAVSMPGRDVFPRFISLPPVERKRIPELVRYEARTQMPFPIDEVIWDYQPLSDTLVPGEEVEVALFAIKRATVHTFLANLSQTGLAPDIVEISPLALYNFLLYDRTIETGTVIIDIGAGNTDLVIIDGEKFWTRNVSISGNDITRALQEKYQISFEEAENLKRKAAASKQADKVFGVMRPILDDLIGEVQRSIGYYKAQSRNVRIEQVILLGNAFKLRGLLDYFRKNLDYQVSLLDSLRRVKLGTDEEQREFEAELPNYGVAIGLALQALGVGRINIDLMPREIIRQRLLRRKVPWAAAAAAFLVIPIALGFLRVRSELARYHRNIGGVETQIRELRELEAELDKLRSPEPMTSQLKELGSLGEKRLQWLEVLDKFNLAFSQIERERFLARSLREPVPEDRSRGGARPEFTREMLLEGVPGPAPPPEVLGPGALEGEGREAKKPTGLVVEAKFEKRGPWDETDKEYLLSKLRAAGITNAEVVSVDRDIDRTIVPAYPTDSTGAVEGPEVYVFTVWARFGEEPRAEEKAAEGGSGNP